MPAALCRSRSQIHIGNVASFASTRTWRGIPAVGAPSYAGLAARFAAFDQLSAVCMMLLLLASLQIAVAFFAAAGASVATLDLVVRFVLPGLSAEGRRLEAELATRGHWWDALWALWEPDPTWDRAAPVRAAGHP